MKKLLALLLAGAMCLPMLACTMESNQPDDTTAPTVTVTQPATEDTTEPEDATTAPEDETTAPEGDVTEDDATEPEDATTASDDTVAEPEDDTTAPADETTKLPDETTKKPEETTKKPEETTKAPEVSKPDNIPASGTVNMSALSSSHGYRGSWPEAGYYAPVIVLGYGVPISLGHINLANYSKVRIQYGCDGGDGTRDAFASASSLAIGLKSEATSYGQATDDNFAGDIAHGNMTFSADGWAGGARWVEIDLSGVTYAGDVWVAVHNPMSTEIAISAIVFTPNGQADKPVETQPSDVPVENTPADYYFDVSGHSSAILWEGTGFAGKVIAMANYGSSIKLGSLDLSRYNKVVITYGSDASAMLGRVGSRLCLTSTGAVADGNNNPIAANVLASATLADAMDMWAADERTVIIDLSKVNHRGAVYLAFDMKDGNGIAISSIRFTNADVNVNVPVEPDFDMEITMPGNLTLPYVPSQPAQINDWKAIWLSQFDLEGIYKQSGNQRPEADFRRLLNQMLTNVVNDGYNTVIVQVRPNADSMYPSKYYPASKYAVGSYGKNFKYDPFAIIVEIAHQKGLDVHAWINPMRGMSDTEMQSIGANYPIKKWYNDSTKRGKYLVQVNGMWYLNPAYEEVRALIVNGAVEIVEKYDVEGVHMDDYFYPVGPDNTAFDSAAYKDYCRTHGVVGVANFRRICLNKLVSELYGYIKKADSTAIFGVSPAGNRDTVQNTHCADVNTWCSTPGYIDYICPQIYFGFNHATWAFDKGCQVWQNGITTNYVKLIIGVTFHKVGTEDKYAGANGKTEWLNYHDILARSVTYTTTLSKCVGVSVFSYNYLYDPVSGAWKDATSQEHANFNNALKNADW